MVDVVTEQGGNLHDELLARLAPGRAVPLHADLYAAAYRPADYEHTCREYRVPANGG